MSLVNMEVCLKPIDCFSAWGLFRLTFFFKVTSLSDLSKIIYNIRTVWWAILQQQNLIKRAGVNIIELYPVKIEQGIWYEYIDTHHNMANVIYVQPNSIVHLYLI